MIPLVNPQLEGESFFWEGGPAGILLIHGYTATTAEVRPLAQVLHQKGYTVSGPLLPGHATTPEDANRYTWKDWVDACEAAYRQLSLRCDQVFIGGESLGGLLSLYLGSGHPQIAGLLLYSPALRIRSRLEPLLTPIVALFRSTMPKRGGSPSAVDARWQGYDTHPLQATKQLFALQRATLPRLAAITRPVLIIQGRLDATVDPQVPDLIASRVRSAVKQIHWLEESGHCVILDQEWEQAAAITLSFLDLCANLS